MNKDTVSFCGTDNSVLVVRKLDHVDFMDFIVKSLYAP